MTLFFPFYWPFWCLQGRTGNTPLPGLRESSGRAVRTCDGISSGAERAACAGQGAHGGAAGPLIRAATGAPGLEASLQRPGPGHERSENSIFHQRLKRGWSGVRAPSLTVRAVGQRRFFKPPPPFLALSEGPQHRLLRTRVWGLLRGRRPCGGDRRCGASGGERSPLRRGYPDGHRAPYCPGVPKRPNGPLDVTVPPVRGKRPHDGNPGPLHGKAPPRPMGRARGGPGRLPGRLPPRTSVPPGGVGAMAVREPVAPTKGLSWPALQRPPRRVCARLRWGRRRGPRLAQVTAHAERGGGSAPEVSD